MLSWLDDYFSKEEIKTGLRILFVCVLICTGIFVPAMCATTMVSRSAPDFDDALERCASLCAKQVQSVKCHYETCDCKCDDDREFQFGDD